MFLPAASSRVISAFVAAAFAEKTAYLYKVTFFNYCYILIPESVYCCYVAKKS